ncbi:MAG: hypothetical protein ACRDJ5_09915, partial [Actinomycetota bacterium]
MDAARKSCPACGAANRADADWCALCLVAFTPRPQPPPAPPSAAVPGPQSRQRSPWLRVGITVLA